MDLKPALTPEEWRAVTTAGGPCRYDAVFEGTDNAQQHYIAALALLGQWWGFSWDDVDSIRAAADGYSSGDFVGSKGATVGIHLDRLADRIAALLPPRAGD